MSSKEHQPPRRPPHDALPIDQLTPAAFLRTQGLSQRGRHPKHARPLGASRRC